MHWTDIAMLIILAIAFYAFVSRAVPSLSISRVLGFRSAAAAEAALTLAPEMDENGNVKPFTLAQTLGLLDRRDEAPHVWIIGNTGAGKSTFARLVLSARAGRGEQFTILTGKTTEVFAGLPFVGLDLAEDDDKLFVSIERQCKALSRELLRRQDRNAPLYGSYATLTIVIDDASIILAECEAAQQLLRRVLLIGREINIRLIIMTGSDRVKELGIEGRGDLREHFAVITYKKTLAGERITTIRPSFADDASFAFDAASVPAWANKARINPDLAWRARERDDTELARVLGIDFLPGTDAQNTAFSEQEVRKSGSQEVRKHVEKPSDDAIRELLKTQTANWIVNNIPGAYKDRVYRIKNESEQ